MPYPNDVKALCDRLRPYFRDLDKWLKDSQREIAKLQSEVSGLQGRPGDPPPPPPDLGP